MGGNVFQDAMFDGPFEEIQLSEGGFHAQTIAIRDGDAFPSAKGIKSSFGVGFQLQLVAIVDFEFGVLDNVFENARLGGNHITGVLLFGEIGDEPIHDAERNVRFAIHDGHDLFHVFQIRVELQQIL